MAYIEVHQGLIRHRKTYLLAAQLGVSRQVVVGHLLTLWTWALDCASDGVLSHLPDMIIADACEWTGDANNFVGALIDSGFLNADRTIHDWGDYAGRLIERRRMDAQRKRDGRAQNIQCQSAGCPADVQRMSGVTACVPYPTVPNQTKPRTPPLPPTGGDCGDVVGVVVAPDETLSEVAPLTLRAEVVTRKPDKIKPSCNDDDRYGADWLIFYQEYPRHDAGAAGKSAYIQRRKGWKGNPPVSGEDLLAVMRWRKATEYATRDPDRVPYPATFLHSELFVADEIAQARAYLESRQTRSPFKDRESDEERWFREHPNGLRGATHASTSTTNPATEPGIRTGYAGSLPP